MKLRREILQEINVGCMHCIACMYCRGGNIAKMSSCILFKKKKKEKHLILKAEHQENGWVTVPYPYT